MLLKDAQVAYITTPDAAVHSVYGFYINYFSVQNYVLQRLASLYMLLERPFWGCLNGVMVKDVRRCSARRARRILGFNPHRSLNIYMDYVSTVVEKDKCRCYR